MSSSSTTTSRPTTWGPYEQQFKKCEWWNFRRVDGHPWGLAGLWNTWVDKVTGEVHESYTMLTLNADGHPLMGRMHRNELDPETRQPLPLEKQDKRSVIPIEEGNVDQWLAGTVDEATQLLRLAPADAFNAGPVEPDQKSLIPQQAEAPGMFHVS